MKRTTSPRHLARTAMTLLVTLLCSLTGAWAQETVTIGDGTSANYFTPIGTYYSYSFTEQLYTADEIGMAGSIQSISFYYNVNTAKDFPIAVYMKNVDEENLSSSIDIADAELVFEGTLSVTEAGWATIVLDTPFNYDGTSNLLIAINKGYVAWFSGATWRYTAANNMAQYAHNDNNPYDLTTGMPTTTATNNRPNIQMSIVPDSGSVCVKPETVVASNVTTNSATVTWSGGSGRYNVEYKKASDAEWTVAATNIAATTYKLTDLIPGTNYQVHVQSVCDDNSTSRWKSESFQTLFGIPLVEEFATTSLPTGWSIYVGLLSDVMDGTALSTNTSGWYFGSKNGVFDVHANINIYGTSRKHWLVMPAVEMADNVQLSFDMALTAYNGTLAAPATTGTDDKFAVLATTDGGTTWTILRQWDNAGSEYVYNNIACSATGENVAIDLSRFAGQTVAIAFYAESTVNNADNNLHIDNVSIDNIPDCSKPFDIDISDLTPTSAEVTWASDASSWQICFEGNEAAPVTVTSNSYTLTSLTERTAYTVRLRTVCDTGGYSDWATVRFTTPGVFEGSGTSGDPFLLSTVTDWNNLSAMVSEGNTFDGKYLKMTADIGTSAEPVTTMVGLSGKPFSGHFDGNGMTLTVALVGPSGDGRQGTAPFKVVDGATIERLTVAGTVTASATGDAYHAAGLVGLCYKNKAIVVKGCTVAANVVGDGYAGGIVGHGGSGNLTIQDCVYSGAISNIGNFAGGLLGWCDELTFTIQNCLFKGSFAVTGSGKYHPIALSNNGSKTQPTVSKAYYLCTITSTATGTNKVIAGAEGTPVSATYVAGEYTMPVTAPDGIIYYQAKTGAVEDQEVLVGEGTGTSNRVPVSLFDKSSLVQQIYTSDEIGLMGTIKSISFDFTSTQTFSLNNIKVYLKHVEKEYFKSNTDMEAVSESDKVWEGTFTATDAGWVTLDLTTPFDYDGTSNLLVCFYDSDNTDSYFTNRNFRTTATEQNTTLSYSSDTTVPSLDNLTGYTGSKYLYKYRANVKFVITPAEGPVVAKPATLEATEITAHEATLTWTGGTGTYNVEYKKATDETWTTEDTDIPETQLVLTDLEQNTTYQVRVQSVGEGGTVSGWRTVSFTTLVSCPEPTDVSVTLTPGDGTVVTLSWTENGNATAWEVCLNSDYDHPIAADSNPFTLTGLTPEAAYTVMVRAVDGGETSSWSNAVTFQPTDKVVIGYDMTSSSYLPSYIYYNYSMTQQIYTAQEIGATAGAILSVDFYASKPATRTLDIYMVSTTKGSFSGGTDWESVTASDLVFSGEVTFAQNAWTTIEFDTPFDYDGTSNVVLVVDDNTGSSLTSGIPAFLAFSASGQAIRIYSDGTNYDPFNTSTTTGTVMNLKNNIRLAVGEPVSCAKPTGLTASEIEPRSVRLSWTGAADDYTLRYRTPRGFSYGFETAEPWAVDDFDPCTTYDGDGKSTYTISNAAFTNQNYTGACIALQGDWNASYPAHSGNAFGACFNASSGASNDWFILPAITIGEHFVFSFWCRELNTQYGPELIKVGVYGDADGTFASYLAGSETQAVEISNTSWEQLSYDLSAYAGQTIRLAINCVSTEVFALFIDDIFVGSPSDDTWDHTVTNVTSPKVLTGLAPDTDYEVQVQAVCGGDDGVSKWSDAICFKTLESCMKPSKLTHASLQPTSVELSWKANGEENTWVIAYGVNDGTFTIENATTVEVDHNPYMLTDLEPGTAYTVYVRANCGDELSAWCFKPCTFTTPSLNDAPVHLTANPMHTTAALSWEGYQQNYTLRWRTAASAAAILEQDFENVLGDWQTISQNTNNSAAINSDAAVSGSNCFRFSSFNSVSSGSYDQYLISPELTETGTLTFYYRTYGQYGPESFEICYSTGGSEVADFTAIEGTQTSTSETSWQQFSCELPTGTKYVAIHYTSSYNAYLYIDDIAVSGDDIPAGEWHEVQNAVSPCTITGLTAKTKYEWQVKGYSPGIESDWSEPAIFSTASDDIMFFVKDGDWSVAENWSPAGLPDAAKNAIIRAAVTIPDGVVATANKVTVDGGSITIKDGGQLCHANFGVIATVEKNIAGYGTGKAGGYSLITTALRSDVNPADVGNMLTGNYDLYAFDFTQDGQEWRNYKEESFTMTQGHAYLYANSEDVTLSFTGELIPIPEEGYVQYVLANRYLDYSEEEHPLANWNLIGNPHPCNAYLTLGYYNSSLSIADNPLIYTLNGDGDAVVPASEDPANVSGGVFMVSQGSNYPALSGSRHYKNNSATDDPMALLPNHGMTTHQNASPINITLADNADNTTVLAGSAGKTVNVTLADRTLYKDGTWNTICLPFDVTVRQGSTLEGAIAKTLADTHIDGNTVTMTFGEPVEELQAGVPYIIKWDNTADITISSADEWNAFAQSVNSATDSYAGKTVRLAADITVSTMVGTVDADYNAVNMFSGTFDGDGHTLTVDINGGNEYYVAPFHAIGNAIIKNLRVTGTVHGGMHCAGLVGIAENATTNSIQNCVVATEVVCDGTNHTHCGGILGHGRQSATTVTDCLFSGTISGSTTATGIIYGWGDSPGTHTIVNCLAAGTYTGSSGVDLLKKNGGTEVVTNCYKTENVGSLGTYTTASGHDLATMLGTDWQLDANSQPTPRTDNVIDNPTFPRVTIAATAANSTVLAGSAATAATSTVLAGSAGKTATAATSTVLAGFAGKTANVKFFGYYSPLADVDKVLLDAHNTANGAFRAALSINAPTVYTDAAMTTPATTIPFADDGTVTLYAVMLLPGDANGDGKVDIADVTAIINYINNAPPAGFNFDAANVNGDSAIDIGDVTGVINMINKQ